MHPDLAGGGSSKDLWMFAQDEAHRFGGCYALLAHAGVLWDIPFAMPWDERVQRMVDSGRWCLLARTANPSLWSM